MTLDLDALDAIEARANAATAGPWKCGRERDEVGLIVHAHTYLSQTVIAPPGSGYRPQEDSAFIAAARSDVPALIAEVRRLKARVSQLSAAGAAGQVFCRDNIALRDERDQLRESLTTERERHAHTESAREWAYQEWKKAEAERDQLRDAFEARNFDTAVDGLARRGEVYDAQKDSIAKLRATVERMRKAASTTVDAMHFVTLPHGAAGRAAADALNELESVLLGEGE